MPKTNEQLPDQTERLINAIDDLNFNIDNMKKYYDKDYSSILTNIILSLKEIGNLYTNDGCLNKIHDDLKHLNKTMLLIALLISTNQNPENTLQQYSKIIEQHLN